MSQACVVCHGASCVKDHLVYSLLLFFISALFLPQEIILKPHVIEEYETTQIRTLH